ncbi:hypothetical protein BLS_003493 [Venturia inaequalis]|uniref:Uncharacterized protein n=1 Tax=Venturia inaequalis TaxID=5025 RepID=A0A8H3URY6_VENIN|nr:hypothetical protein BLS_003493 [Venturia inaequalis]KAE9973725.1 hypothetical protein EG328_004239 [Venturia inaequalis]KAE9990188.1 hypothetical protein EG327_001733 [Venturia inaequalis]RDI77412.1 hypothetical protein Vi05172_g12603 [Venturia inaequalis]
MATSQLSQLDYSSLRKMDPYVHSFAMGKVQQEPRIKWRGPTLIRNVLRTLRKQLHRNAEDDVREHLHRKTQWTEEHKEIASQRNKIPSIVKLSPSPPDTSSPRRSSIHRSRSLSKTRPTAWYKRMLSSIPESGNEEDEAEDSSTSPSLQAAETQPPLAASFLGLPTELRLQIYGYVFSDWADKTSLQLLKTCRQINAEASDLAFSKTLFRLRSEHWADHDYFQVHSISLLPRARLSSVRHLALRLPRGAPYDCYSTQHLGVDLASLGLQLKTLVIFSHHARPLPRNSDYGGVLETSLCVWLRDALYSMPTLTSIRIVNYESATPGLFDIPSPRLVRLLRGEIFKDAIHKRQTPSEEEFQWECVKGSDRSYRVFSSKLGRKVHVRFEDGECLGTYGLSEIRELEHMVNPDELIKNTTHPDLSMAGYAGLLAKKNSQRRSVVTANSSRRRLGRSPSQRREPQESDDTCGGNRFSPSHGPESGRTRKRMSKRISLPSPPSSNPVLGVGEMMANQSNTMKRRSWHPLARAGSEKKGTVVVTSG